MFRLFLTDTVPLLVFLYFLQSIWISLYDNAVTLSIFAIVCYLVFLKMQRIEFSVSRIHRSILINKTVNAKYYNFVKFVSVMLVIILTNNLNLDDFGNFEKSKLWNEKSSPHRSKSSQQSDHNRQNGDRKLDSSETEQKMPVNGTSELQGINERSPSGDKKVSTVEKSVETSDVKAVSIKTKKLLIKNVHVEKSKAVENIEREENKIGSNMASKEDEEANVPRLKIKKSQDVK